MSVFRTVATVVLLAAAGMAVSGQKRTEVAVGMPLPVCSATAASGRWAIAHPFDAKSYGKVSGHSPAASPDAKVVIYTTSLSPEFLNFAKAVDQVITNRKLVWSFVQVIDAKGAQFGGYTASELANRIEAVRKLASDNHIDHLSFVISASNAESFAKRLQLFEGDDVLIAYVTAAPDDGHAAVKWFTMLNSTKLTKESLAGVVALLTKAI